MSGVFKRSFAFSVLLLTTLAPFAQKVGVEVGAPAVVAAGEVFRVEFAVNAKPSDFKAPVITGFEVLAGPTVSHGTSISIVNGEVTKTVNYSYMYVLQASAEGRFTIPPVEVTVEGKVYSSRATAIDVVAGGAQQGTPQSASQGSGQGQQTHVPAAISPDDMMINASVSRASVYKGQPVKLTLKMYKRVNLGGISGTKLPAFNGFWSQELQLNPNRQWARENYGNKVYDALVIGEYLLYPQQSGTLTIEPFELTAVAQIIVQSQNRSPFDDFFGGGQQVQEVRKELRTKPLQVTVKDLPGGAPVGFSGAVGDFTMDANLPSRSVAANSAATYTIKIAGSGNLPLIQAPKISMPGSLEQYNIKTTESLSSSGAGISGYRQFEYPFIPRAEGACIIDAVEFSYFNPETGRYVTLSAPAVELNVTPDGSGGAHSDGGGLVSGLTKEDIRILGKDIRFIKIGDPGLRPAGRVLMASGLYFMMLALVALLAVAAYFLFAARIRLSGNMAAVRGKRANKVALQRLRAADGFRRGGDRKRFLEEMLRALWGYMGDRLNIPAASLTRDNVREKLTRRGVAPAQTDRYIDVISDCELAQYSPAQSGQVDEIYRAGVEAISAMETALKNTAR